MASLIIWSIKIVVSVALLFWLSWYAFEKWEWLQKVSWYKWWLLFLIVNAIDIHSTFMALSRGGAQEDNPIIAYLFDKIGIWGTLLFLKLGAVVLAFAVGLYLACRSDHKNLKLYDKILFSLVLILFLVSLWNYSMAIFPR